MRKIEYRRKTVYTCSLRELSIIIIAIPNWYILYLHIMQLYPNPLLYQYNTNYINIWILNSSSEMQRSWYQNQTKTLQGEIIHQYHSWKEKQYPWQNISKPNPAIYEKDNTPCPSSFIIEMHGGSKFENQSV